MTVALERTLVQPELSASVLCKYLEMDRSIRKPVCNIETTCNLLGPSRWLRRLAFNQIGNGLKLFLSCGDETLWRANNRSKPMWTMRRVFTLAIHRARQTGDSASVEYAL